MIQCICYWLLKAIKWHGISKLYRDSTIRRPKKFCNMRHYKHNSRVSQQGLKICILRFNTSQEHVNEDLTLSLAWLQCLKPKWKQLLILQPTLFRDIWLAVLFSAKSCHVRSPNLAEVEEENTHTESLSLRNENDFLKLVVSSRPVISMNFPGNSLFLRFPKNLPGCS